MSLWRKTRSEMAGAWRSLRYDLGRRPEQPAAAADPADVTYTGLSTFGGVTPEPRTGYDEFGRPPRRLVAVGAFVALALVGAGGSYFAVVNGLSGMLRNEPAAAPRPLAAAAPTGAAEADATSGMGRGPAAASDVATTALAVPPPEVPAPTTPPAAARPAPPRSVPARPGTPTAEDCDCLTPPVPTPTAPPSPSPTPSESSSPSASPSASESASESPSADPSASDSGSPAGRRHREH
jgi:hypothetical protein